MDFRINTYGADEIVNLFDKGMSPTGRAERHGMKTSPTKRPLVEHGLRSRTNGDSAKLWIIE
jgi:hypothetical protein